jgi:hypothetical protein
MNSAILLLVTGTLGQAPAPAAAAIPAPDVQIAAAVLAIPPERRAAATVLGYDAQGALVTLRAGTNDMVCLADDPKTPKLNVACYHKDLEPFMARGRELLAKGVKGEERETTRWKEIDAGTLKMPREPRTLYVLTGTGFDAATGNVTDAYTRWVVYIPYATAESTGLSPIPVPGGPWIMNAGKPSAHIMISPERPEKK